MSECPTELHYTKTHEWVRMENDEVVTVGITDHAQGMLGDLVFVELPEVNREVAAGEEIVVVESVKTAADVYSPLTGEVIAVNEELNAAPEQVNQEPYGIGWLFQIRINNKEELENLLNAENYQSSVEEE